MNELFILLLMIFFHIVDDYYLQGILKSIKQKQWWKENAPDEIYKYDYIWALLVHGFSWGFMIMLPIAFKMNFLINIEFALILIGNAVLHAFFDDIKANDKAISLVQDQLLHLLQIIATFLMFI